MTKAVLKVGGKDITSLVGGITLNSSVDTLGDQLSFGIAYARYHYTNILVGDLVQLYDDKKEVFRGIIVTKTRNENAQDFSCFDFAFYLNKSKVIKQFNKVRADVAIKQLLAEFNIPVGNISNIPVIIKKIYFDKEVSEVIKDILQAATNVNGKKYNMEMNNGKLDIYMGAEKTVKAYVRLADNVAFVDCMDTISGASKTVSIENMKNSIKLYIGDEKKVKTYAQAKDDNLIKKYGLLQETQSLEEKDKAKAKSIANVMLKSLGKLEVNASITVVGNFLLRAGRMIEVKEPTTNIVGKYRIKSANHSVGQYHQTMIELEEA